MRLLVLRGVAAIALTVTAASADTSAPRRKNPGQAKLVTAEPLIVVGARELQLAYAQDEAKADARFRARTIEVSGVFQDMSRAGGPSKIVCIHYDAMDVGDDDCELLSTVLVADELAAPTAVRCVRSIFGGPGVPRGAPITVRGRAHGLFKGRNLKTDGVLLTECVVVR